MQNATGPQCGGTGAQMGMVLRWPGLERQSLTPPSRQAGADPAPARFPSPSPGTRPLSSHRCYQDTGPVKPDRHPSAGAGQPGSAVWQRAARPSAFTAQDGFLSHPGAGPLGNGCWDLHKALWLISVRFPPQCMLGRRGSSWAGWGQGASFSGRESSTLLKSLGSLAGLQKERRVGPLEKAV